MSIRWIGSPNKEKGRQGYRVEAIVIHIMEGTLVGTDSWFKSQESGVSAHYGVGTDGEVHQYVADGDTAWHAGYVVGPSWRLIKPGVNPNYYTIGIEHEGTADTPWTDAMYQASAELIRDICHRWSVPFDRDRIIGHREIRADKSCPGHQVDLGKLVEMARTGVVAPEAYNFCGQPGSVRTRVDLNVRRAAPTTTVEVIRTVPTGTELSYEGWTSNGLSVNGNAHWYKEAAGNYFWAGGTERPIPGLG